MKTGLDIIDRLYLICEATGISNLISGTVHKSNYNPKPNSIESEFIIINTLRLTNYDVIRGVPANINLYVADIDGEIDSTRLRYLAGEVENLLGKYASVKNSLVLEQTVRDKDGNYTTNEVDLSKEYFKFKIATTHGPFKDEAEKVFSKHSKHNIRVNCWIEQ